MKINLRLFTFFIILSLCMSCSKDEVSQNTNLLGVWERISFDADATNTYLLIFGQDQTGLRIHRSEGASGEVTSMTDSFDWKAIDDIVTLSENNNVKEVYVINSEGNLVLNTLEDLPLDKISDDYSRYY